MSEQTGQERTEEATPKKLKESRDKGQVPRSKELNTMALLMAAAGAFLLLGEKMLNDLGTLLKSGLQIKQPHLMDHTVIMEIFSDIAVHSLVIMAPLLIILTVAVVMTPLGLGGWSFSMKAMSFKIDKLDPIKGIGRIFALKGLMELAKVLAKFLLVAGVSAVLIWSLIDELIGLGDEPVKVALAHVARLCGWAFISCSSMMIIIAAIDAPFQLWQHNKQLKMTKQEVKDENKETDGRPEVKSRIRAIQQEMSQRRMMEKIPDADVVITNPTHYAVALRYDQSSSGAPVVVAKGADLIAMQIRKVADKNQVTIVSAPPLARALFASTEIDHEIPSGLYVAVATILSYVYQLKITDETGDRPPAVPEDLPIPDELADLLQPDESDTDNDQVK